jgi:L-seryl-tRNA(Ser) seleniumtransferase
VLRRYTDMGADLVIFSGGKGIRGPQSSGLILGKRELIEACAMNGSPFHGVGRPMKVGKEEIAGLVTAVELWADPEFERRQLDGWEQRTAAFVDAMRDLRAVRVYRAPSPPPSSGRAINPSWFALAHVEWDEAVIGKTPQQVVEVLRRGEPGIIIPSLPTGLMFSPQCLEPGEEGVVAARLREALRAG